MNTTNIEWVKNPDGTDGMTVNPIGGRCLHNCPYCYADLIRRRYSRPESIEYFPKRLDVAKLKKQTTVFVGSMHDVFGSWVKQEWIENTLNFCKHHPEHIFIFLTKNGKRMKEFIPKHQASNIWWGQTLTGNEDLSLYHFVDLETENSFISGEPLLGGIVPDIAKTAKWYIIGSLNLNYRPLSEDRGGTKLIDVKHALEFALSNKMEVFMKPQIYQLFPELPRYKQIPFLKQHSLV